MLNLRNWFLLIIAAFSGIHCLQTDGTSDWATSMRGMADSYEKLIPYMFDSKRYSDPNNKKFISTYLSNINEMASGLDKHTGNGLSGGDPLFNVGIKDLKSIIRKSSESYFVESYGYSQQLLQTSLNYCNTCHSRTSIGPTFIQPDKFESITARLDPMDHARVLVATRQFPKAIGVLETSLVNKTWKEADANDEALKRLMTITLKNAELPEKAYKILMGLKLPNLPEQTKKEIPEWKKYLSQWKSGKLETKENSRLLLKKRNKGVKPAHFVEAVHESMILHKSLSIEQEKMWRARTYGALGRIYGAYPTLGFWSLPATYYETCIYESPGTATAMKCYYSLESRIQSQANGPNGEALLKIEEPKLKKLKALASKKSGAPTSASGRSGAETW